MLKSTKVVGIASAFALLTGLAFAPIATAVGGDVPTQSDPDSGDNFDAGDRIDYYVDYVRTGCEVTTTVGNRSKTVRAKYSNSGAKTNGKVDNFLTAPGIAGEYKFHSMVSKSCASDPGYKRAQDMSADITVGDELVWDGSASDSGAGLSQQLEGTIENSGGSGVDLDGVKVNFVVKGKVVASAYTDSSGAVSAFVAGKHLNPRGNTRISVKLDANKYYYMSSDSYETVNPT